LAEVETIVTLRKTDRIKVMKSYYEGALEGTLHNTHAIWHHQTEIPAEELLAIDKYNRIPQTFDAH
jgi:hypothetical protein